MRKFRYSHRLDRIKLYNRWTYNKWRGLTIESSDWTVVGIAQRYFSHEEYEWLICFFGFEIRIWMIRKPK